MEHDPSASDERFAGKAQYFADHYSEVRGRVRLELVMERLLAHLPAPPARILDAGGGTGAFAIPLAALGHDVTMLEPEDEWLTLAKQHAAEEGANVHFIPGRAEHAPDLVDGPFDAILCHVVLAYVDRPGQVLSALRTVAADGALLSSMEKNRHGLPVRPGIRGDYVTAVKLLDDPYAAGGLGIVNRAFSPAELRSILLATGWRTEWWGGVRLFSDSAPEPEDDETFRSLLELDREAGRREPLRRMTRFVHVLARGLPERAPSLEAVQGASFARAGRATRESLPQEKALTVEELAELFRRKRYATLSTTRPDGRPHAAMVGYLERSGRIWIPSVSGAARLRNLAAEPSASLVVSEGEGEDHVVAIIEAEAIVHEDPHSLLDEFLVDAWRDRYGTELTWAGAIIKLLPTKVLSYGHGRLG
jgi:2-polyprenyl-3-methyl-5-hydroxy-6-metoxy-1,4-benzoquinol methylase